MRNNRRSPANFHTTKIPSTFYPINKSRKTLGTNYEEKEERGSPYLKPLPGVIGPIGSLITSTVKVTKVMYTIIHSTHFSAKPILNIISRKLIIKIRYHYRNLLIFEVSSDKKSLNALIWKLIFTIKTLFSVYANNTGSRIDHPYKMININTQFDAWILW